MNRVYFCILVYGGNVLWSHRRFGCNTANGHWSGGDIAA